ncbi:hypothetical protein BLA29_014061 [Euroglyphus maynei]|uniref:Uncharacterized protein n=1 Tax=Euroglyphus maynei TaxID=6958 RepID=A0A1Y3BR57_EURMA|nr:hypothetical protein BLA29_014061 [Euroglyphus maynei]
MLIVVLSLIIYDFFPQYQWIDHHHHYDLM